jgi:hypothetical protein
VTAVIDGRSVCDLYKRASAVRLTGVKFPVSVSWYYLKRDNGKKEKRFVLSTNNLRVALLLGGADEDGK